MLIPWLHQLMTFLFELRARRDVEGYAEGYEALRVTGECGLDALSLTGPNYEAMLGCMQSPFRSTCHVSLHLSRRIPPRSSITVDSPHRERRF